MWDGAVRWISSITFQARAETLGDKRVVGGEDEAAGAIFAELALLAGLEHAEGLAGIVLPHDVGWIEDVAQLVAGETIGDRIPGIELGPQMRAARLVPSERRSLIAQIAREGSHGIAGVG